MKSIIKFLIIFAVTAMLSAAFCALAETSVELPQSWLDQYAEKPAVMMAALPGDTLDGDYVALCQSVLRSHGEKEEIDFIHRLDFYKRAEKAHCVVVTGECRKYGNLLLKKGVIC